MYIYLHACLCKYNVLLIFAICISDDRILYIANNPGSGYVSRVFDSNLGHFFLFRVHGDYLYAERVRINYYHSYLLFIYDVSNFCTWLYYDITATPLFMHIINLCKYVFYA